MMFGILDRYIGWTIARSSAMTILVLVILLSFVNLVEELEQVNHGGITMGDALLVSLLTAPRYLFEVFPVAALLGSLLGLGGLATRSELVAMRTAGFSLGHIMLAVLKVGVLMVLVVIVFSEFLAPSAEQYAQELRTGRLLGQQALTSRYGFWARDEQAFINIRSLGDGRHLRDITIYEFDGDDRLSLTTHATRAGYEGDHWVLRNIVQSELGESGVQIRSLASMRWDFPLDPALLSAVVVRPTMLPLWELADYIALMRENAQSAIDYEVAFWLKIINPFATLGMLFLAVPFVLRAGRNVGVGQRIFLGAVVGAVFFLLTRALSYVVVVYRINPAVTAVVLACVFLALLLLLLQRVR